MTADDLSCDGGAPDNTCACGALPGCCTLTLGASLRRGLMFPYLSILCRANMPCCRIDADSIATSWIAVMVCNESGIFMAMMMPVGLYMEIGKDKKSREPVVRPPERIVNPGIKVCIIRQRCIICDNRRSLA